MATPEQVTVWIGLDVGKESHFADVLDNDGECIFIRAANLADWCRRLSLPIE